MLNKILVSLFIIALVAMGVCFGAGYIQETFEPQVKYVEVPVVRTVHHYIEELVEVVKEVEVIVEKPVQLREFESVEELKEWLQKERARIIFAVYFSSPDCDEFAYYMLVRATKCGYRMNVQIDTRKEHALNSAFIGNKVYFIEPQTNEVWFECYRDKE